MNLNLTKNGGVSMSDASPIVAHGGAHVAAAATAATADSAAAVATRAAGVVVSRRGRAAKVGIYLGPRAFYTKDMENKERVAQHGDLPPRCAHCRRSWDTTLLDGVAHCDEHRRACDGTCGRSEEET